MLSPVNGLPVRFLSTPSVRRATLLDAQLSGNNRISIHALREEGDKMPTRPTNDISQFLSTPSVRRATSPLTQIGIMRGYFYPRPP